MKNNTTLNNFGEIEIINLIEEIIFQKTRKHLIRDDSFFISLGDELKPQDDTYLVLNSDMLVSTTDAPPQMNHYQIGRKAVLMNISDLIVKGVVPKYIVLSLGLPKKMEVNSLRELIEGIVDYCLKLNIDYIGGDLNETKELILNPTVVGFQKKTNIIYRNGITVGDLLVANGKFGLTGVGLDILVNKRGIMSKYLKYKRSINSVLESEDLGKEALILAKNNLATASIDSSDGLAKSLTDLMLSNPNLGFEIDFNEKLVDGEAIKYAQEYNVSIENLVFNGGEEFIHIFTINPKCFDAAQKVICAKGGEILKIGKVISEETIYFLKEDKKLELKSGGYEHFKWSIAL